MLCVERLSHWVDQVVSQNLWKEVKVSRNGPMILHLFFPDDLLLFGEATEDQMQVILTCLERFCDYSSQQINFQKSQLYCSSNVSDQHAMYLSTLARIPSLMIWEGTWVCLPFIEECVIAFLRLFYRQFLCIPCRGDSENRKIRLVLWKRLLRRKNLGVWAFETCTR